jgi:hypothetical protein
MKSILTILLLAGGLVCGSSGFSQKLFLLKKENNAAQDSTFSVLIPAPNTGAVCTNLDSIRREISGNRDAYLLWRRTRQQAWYLVNIDENGQPSDFRADGPPNEMHEWMQQYLGAMRFNPAWIPGVNQSAQPFNPGTTNASNAVVTRASVLRFALPGMEWPRFEQDYYLASLVEARCRAEKPGECVEGYVRMRVLVDAKGKVLSHEVLAGENESLNKIVGDELYQVGFKPAVSVGVKELPETSWGYLDFEFQSRACR